MLITVSDCHRWPYSFEEPQCRFCFLTPGAPAIIDLTALRPFVFALKRARSPDHAIRQLTRYMGWMRQTIGRDREVNGVIVAKEISDSLRYALSVVPNVRLFEYEVNSHLRPAHEIARSDP
jgi:hypothetical protein